MQRTRTKLNIEKLEKLSEDLLSDFRNGYTLLELGKKYHTHWSVIKNVLSKKPEYNSIALAKYSAEAERRRKVSAEDTDYMCDLYEQGMTLQALAEEFHISHQRVWKILKKKGVKTRRAGRSSLVVLAD